MQRIYLCVFFIVNCLIFISDSSFAIPKFRIACLGDDIIFGYSSEKNSLHCRLQSILGERYEVMNFGVGSTRVNSGEFNSYLSTNEFKEAIASNPDIVFIGLGISYVPLKNSQLTTQFNEDYKVIISSFKKLPSRPRIILLIPIVLSEALIKEFIPMIQQVAFDEQCELIDLHFLLVDHPEYSSDQLHPSLSGTDVIAGRLYEAIVLKEKKRFNLFSRIKEAKTISSFYGYECADFTFFGRKCKVAKPRKVANGLPWIWRARFWGVAAQTDISLLERGFHVVYCDVAELFGNAEAIQVWNRFYDYMHHAGLSKKVALEGMSRGGIYIYNWALVNPDKVACVYADAPVLDLKSWPGGKGSGTGSKNDWEIFKKDYGFTTDEQAMQFKGNPLDKVAIIAKGDYPMLHVVGDADEAVPVAENTGLFELRIKELGGNITVIHKPGVGHVHGLSNSTPIIEFILKATHQKINFMFLRAPGC